MNMPLSEFELSEDRVKYFEQMEAGGAMIFLYPTSLRVRDKIGDSKAADQIKLLGRLVRRSGGFPSMQRVVVEQSASEGPASIRATVNPGEYHVGIPVKRR